MGTNRAWGVRQREKLRKKPRFLAEVIVRTVGNPGETHNMFSLWAELEIFVGNLEGFQEAGI